MKRSLDIPQKIKLITERGLACEKCGYSAHSEILVIHHKIPMAWGGDNRKDNLEVLCPNCHALEHHAETWEDMMNTYKCSKQAASKNWRETHRKEIKRSKRATYLHDKSYKKRVI